MICNRIKEAREQLGMSQEALAQKANVSRTMISKLETNQKVDCKVSTLISISDALDCRVGDIFLPGEFNTVNTEDAGDDICVVEEKK